MSSTYTPGVYVPSLSDFTNWVFTVMGVPTANLPTSAPSLTWAFDLANEIVDDNLASISSLGYYLALYNFAGHQLIVLTQDTVGQTFWSGLRESFGLNSFTPGVVSGSSDNGTSVSVEVVEMMKGLTIDQLDLTKTPYGRTYLGWAAKAGTLWGMS